MKVDFMYEKPLDEIVTEVLRMETIMESEQEALMTQIGKEIKKAVQDNLPKSDSTEHKHMKNDVKVTVSGKKKQACTLDITLTPTTSTSCPTA